MERQILEIRSTQALSRETAERIKLSVAEAVNGYVVLVMDGGLSAHIHDEQILNELRGIKELLEQEQATKIKGSDILAAANRYRSFSMSTNDIKPESINDRVVVNWPNNSISIDGHEISFLWIEGLIRAAKKGTIIKFFYAQGQVVCKTLD